MDYGKIYAPTRHHDSADADAPEYCRAKQLTLIFSAPKEPKSGPLSVSFGPFGGFCGGEKQTSAGPSGPWAWRHKARLAAGHRGE
jgi:hypothetical protein